MKEGGWRINFCHDTLVTEKMQDIFIIFTDENKE